MPRAGYKPQPRYSKVTRAMWNDVRFLALSSPKPNGQTLWMRLLTGPELTSIPGLFSAGEAGLAEALGWPLEGFREAFREVVSQGLAKADWKARLVWVPKALEHNRPESANVIRKWSLPWGELPECALKIEAYAILFQAIQEMDVDFQEAFREAIPSPERKPSWNQEQEQEQKQKPQEETEGGKPAKAPALPPAEPLVLIPKDPPPPPTPLLAYLAKEFAQAKAGPENEFAWQEAFPGVDLLAESKNARRWEHDNPKFIKTQKRRFLGNWFARAQNSLRKIAQAPGRPIPGAHVHISETAKAEAKTPGRKFIE